jgi:CsoR family transcriptional regulator, copper-sensing transcriptional repressor
MLSVMSTDQKKRVITRLKRIEGQIAGLRRMIESDTYCVDVLTQVSAAQGALGRVGEIVLGAHIETCVTGAFEHGGDEERRSAIEELMDVFARYGRLAGR